MGRTARRLDPVACPACGSTRLGRIGANHYYCGDCCMELQYRRDQVELFSVDEEGNLVPAGCQPLAALSSQQPAPLRG